MKNLKTNLFTVLMLALVAGFITSCDPKEDNVEPTGVSYSYMRTTFTVEDKTVTIKDVEGGDGVGTRTFSSDTTYILDGRVFINNGQTLTIEPGTLILGKPGQEENSSALIVAQGGKLMAEGTAAMPIVMTALGDNLTGSGTITARARALWGGLIILGKAETNNSVAQRIEGIPSTEPRGQYGFDGNSGASNTDNSGVIKYLQIRHGGTNIGDGNEINGLTLAAVGSGTVIDYVEVTANDDDGVEFFGGVPQLKHILVSYCTDDCYDYDQGFAGKGQFWLALQDVAIGDNCGEHDGGNATDEEKAPYARPTIYNATYLGNGLKRAIIFRENAGGFYKNSIFASTTKGIEVEYTANKTETSYKQLLDGGLVLANNIFQDVADGTTAKVFYIKGRSYTVGTETKNEDLPTDAVAKAAEHFNTNNNKVEALGLVKDSGTDGSAVFVPAAGKANAGVAPVGAWFTNVTYQGAFEPGTASSNWAKGWSFSLK